MTPITAQFHQSTFDALVVEVLADSPNLDMALLADFINYKTTGNTPDHFGRDAPYIQPVAAYNAHMMHIHLKFPPDKFPRNLPQIDRVCRKGSPQKDAALVYVQGNLEENHYCLLAILHPDAHAKAREEKIMRYLARLAQEFRDTH